MLFNNLKIDKVIYPPHNGFMAIIFSAQVNGKFTTFSNASQTPFKGSIQAEKGSRNMYHHATKNAIGQPRNHRMRNQRIPHNIPGHKPPLPFPSPVPSPVPISGCLVTESDQ